MENAVSMVSTVGFPIVCCFFMGWYINTTLKEFTKAMNENTKMLSVLCEKLDGGYRSNE